MKKKVTFIATAAFLSSAYAAHASDDTHTVQKGDTLGRIAKAYSTSVDELKSLNNLSSDTIYPDQKLTVKGQKQKPATQIYTIEKGDTLSAIAARHKISLANLVAWNELETDLIYPGQTLVVSKTAAAPNPVTVQSHPIPASPPPSNESTVVIQPGDTLGKVAQKHEITVQQLKEWNQLTSDIIYAGQALKVSSFQEEASSEPSISSNDTTLIAEAKKLLDSPYVFGGTNPSGFDCSGFIYYAHNQAGENISRTSSEGYYSRSYYVDKPVAGDLVFFENTYKKGISHLGIYLGNNEFIHADDLGVRITSLNDSYYSKHFDGFKRFY